MMLWSNASLFLHAKLITFLLCLTSNIDAESVRKLTAVSDDLGILRPVMIC